MSGKTFATILGIGLAAILFNFVVIPAQKKRIHSITNQACVTVERQRTEDIYLLNEFDVEKHGNQFILFDKNDNRQLSTFTMRNIIPVFSKKGASIICCSRGGHLTARGKEQYISNSTVFRLDMKNGRIKWKHKSTEPYCNADVDLSQKGLVLIERRFPEERFSLHLLDAITGKEIYTTTHTGFYLYAGTELSINQFLQMDWDWDKVHFFERPNLFYHEDSAKLYRISKQDNSTWTASETPESWLLLHLEQENAHFYCVSKRKRQFFRQSFPIDDDKYSLKDGFLVQKHYSLKRKKAFIQLYNSSDWDKDYAAFRSVNIYRSGIAGGYLYHCNTQDKLIRIQAIGQEVTKEILLPDVCRLHCPIHIADDTLDVFLGGFDREYGRYRTYKYRVSLLDEE